MKRKIGLVILSVLLMFLSISCSSEQEVVDDYKLSISAPSGAPLLSIASLNNTYKEDYDYTLGLDATALRAEFISKEKDIIIAPINLGATLYNKNSQDYVLASSLTFGNLYIASQKNISSINDLNNQDVILFGENTINQAIVLSVFTGNNISPNITYVASTQVTSQTLLSDSNSIVLVAEPALSTVKSKLTNVFTISIQEEYKKINNTSYIQAACFINKETISLHKTVVDTFLTRLEESVSNAINNPTEVATYGVELGIGNNATILANAIPNCGLGYVKGIENKTILDKLFENNLSYCGGKLPDEEFYYNYE